MLQIAERSAATADLASNLGLKPRFAGRNQEVAIMKRQSFKMSHYARKTSYTKMKSPQPEHELVQHKLARVARFPGLRALAWSGELLYASRGYEVLQAKVGDPSQGLNWQPVARFRPAWNRRLSVHNRLTARLFRDGFHALAVLPSGGMVAAVPGAILTLRPNDSVFRKTHAITRGTRPLHITAVPGGTIYWGEYFDNAARDEVHIYASTDAGETWRVAHTFPKGAIRHVHNIVHDPRAHELGNNCLWILTGDYGDECRILCAACDLRRVEVVMQGKQQARAVAAIAAENGFYFSTDTPLEANFIYRLDLQSEDKSGNLIALTAINGSSIYACRVGCRTEDRLYFSTMVEPSEVNRDGHVRIYGVTQAGWQEVLSWKKDRWPMGLFQYGNAILPDGENSTPYLAVTTVAVEKDDMVTSLYLER